jgi:hypothetical protein
MVPVRGRFLPASCGACCEAQTNRGGFFTWCAAGDSIEAGYWLTRKASAASSCRLAVAVPGALFAAAGVLAGHPLTP